MKNQRPRETGGPHDGENGGETFDIAMPSVASRYSIGQLAPGLIHDVSNATAFLLMAFQQLARRIRLSDETSLTISNDDMLPLIDDLTNSVKRIDQLISSYRLLSKATSPESMLVVELGPMLQAAVVLGRSNAARGVTLQTNIPSNLPSCTGEYLVVGTATSVLLYEALQAPDKDVRSKRVLLEAKTSNQQLTVSIAVHEDREPTVPDGDREHEPVEQHREETGTGTSLAVELSRAQVRSLGGDATVQAMSDGTTVYLLRIPLE